MKAIKFCLAVLFVLFVGFIALGFFVSNDEKTTTAAKAEDPKKEEAKKDDAPEKLDLSKPTFTQDYAAICPWELMSDNRADHSPSVIIDAMTSIWNRSGRLKDLGCEEWRGGIRVFATSMGDGKGDGIVLVTTGPYGGDMFTLSSQLTNHGPASDPEPSAHEAPVTPPSASGANVVAPDNPAPAPAQEAPASPAPAADPAQAPVNPPTSAQPDATSN